MIEWATYPQFLGFKLWPQQRRILEEVFEGRTTQEAIGVLGQRSGSTTLMLVATSFRIHEYIRDVVRPDLPVPGRDPAFTVEEEPALVLIHGNPKDGLWSVLHKHFFSKWLRPFVSSDLTMNFSFSGQAVTIENMDVTSTDIFCEEPPMANRELTIRLVDHNRVSALTEVVANNSLLLAICEQPGWMETAPEFFNRVDKMSTIDSGLSIMAFGSPQHLEDPLVKRHRAAAHKPNSRAYWMPTPAMNPLIDENAIRKLVSAGNGRRDFLLDLEQPSQKEASKGFINALRKVARQNPYGLIRAGQRFSPNDRVQTEDHLPVVVVVEDRLRKARLEDDEGFIVQYLPLKNAAIEIRGQTCAAVFVEAYTAAISSEEREDLWMAANAAIMTCAEGWRRLSTPNPKVKPRVVI